MPTLPPLPGAPRLPYPRSGGTISVRLPPTRMPCSPLSQPLITSPKPSAKVSVPRSNSFHSDSSPSPSPPRFEPAIGPCTSPWKRTVSLSPELTRMPLCALPTMLSTTFSPSPISTTVGPSSLSDVGALGSIANCFAPPEPRLGDFFPPTAASASSPSAPFADCCFCAAAALPAARLAAAAPSDTCAPVSSSSSSSDSQSPQKASPSSDAARARFCAACGGGARAPLRSTPVTCARPRARVVGLSPSSSPSAAPTAGRSGSSASANSWSPSPV
mmetsp:Transcript_4668/g.11982  ORF Transcript_4668/g.11982 Transcript_4668/m.11982 type:complete len:273 (+) Transcript_4668:327-1145(+)